MGSAIAPSLVKPVVVGFALMGLSFGVWAYFVRRSSADATVEVTDASVVIGGTSSYTLPLRDVVSVELVDAIPAVLGKVRGFDGPDGTKKGVFELEGLGRARVYLAAAGGPYVFVRTTAAEPENSVIILSFRETGAARATHDAIRLRLATAH